MLVHVIDLRPAGELERDLVAVQPLEVRAHVIVLVGVIGMDWRQAAPVQAAKKPGGEIARAEASAAPAPVDDARRFLAAVES